MKKSMSSKISKKLTENGENDEKPNLKKGVHFWRVGEFQKIFKAFSTYMKKKSHEIFSMYISRENKQKYLINKKKKIN